MLRLSLMLRLLSPAIVLPRELIAAALNQTCTLVCSTNTAVTLLCHLFGMELFIGISLVLFRY